MILIAESGSTKTTWVIAEANAEKQRFQSQGFNPYTQSRAQIVKTLNEEVRPFVKDIQISAVYFYGAGCSSDKNRELMYNSLKECFGIPEIEIEHDLMGAARALWFNSEGIAGILGTGSNSCVYDGQDIADHIPALGYIMGDEGSGAYMGKKLLRDFMYFKMPEHIHEKISDRFGFDDSDILDHVYKKENPNRWLAGFTHFIAENIEDDYCNELVESAIKDFFDAHITQYPGYRELPFGVVGSIGEVFKKQLEKVCKEYGIPLQKVIKSPIDELVKYHLKETENEDATRE